MEADQVLKRVQWIEEERRKEKDALALLENQMTTLEGNLSGMTKQIQELNGEITRLATVVTRMDQYDNHLTQLRMETRRLVEEIDKDTKKREEEASKVHMVGTKALENDIADVRRRIEVIDKLERSLLLRVEEDSRLQRSVDEVRSQLENLRRDEEDTNRTFRVLEDSRRQDAKRILDLQGEVTTLRKRSDDQRGKMELANNSLRKLDTRLGELSMVEAERRDLMANFMDKQALIQVERDRVWKDWQTRFETVEKQSADVEARLVSMDATQREAKRMQTVLEELVQRVDRRINEITEILRLSEDRFRQEWVTFKADDQKRWTNYTLSQEEQRGEFNRQFERMNDRTLHLEEGYQEQQDLLAQVNEETEKRLQSLLSTVHEWVASFERSVGRTR